MSPGRRRRRNHNEAQTQATKAAQNEIAEVDGFATTKLADAIFAATAFEHDPNLSFRGKPAARGAPDTTDSLLCAA